VVESFPFNKIDAEASKPSWLDRYQNLALTGIKYGSLVLAALLLIFFVVRPAQKALKTPGEAEPKLLAAAETPATEAVPATGSNSETLLEERRENQLAAPAAEVATVAQLLSDTTPRTVAELEAEMNSQTETETTAQPGGSNNNQLAEGVPAPLALRERLTERSHQEPELVAMTLRTWLHEAKH
jgi:flagellar biosynthesis/type III secretory pathway M-ring protein FliF/YscJ